MSYLKIKDNIDLKELEKFGYKLKDNTYIKYIKNGEISISNFNYNKGNIVRDKYDKTTYTGFAFRNEFNQNIKPYIRDLIKADLVEKVEE